MDVFVSSFGESAGNAVLVAFYSTNLPKATFFVQSAHSPVAMLDHIQMAMWERCCHRSDIPAHVVLALACCCAVGLCRNG